MIVLNRLLPLVLLLAAAVAPVSTVAAPGGPSGLYNSFESGKPARDAGTVRGESAGVDYGSGNISVRTTHGLVHIAVLPTTSIYVHGEYATLADLHRGASVEISVSEVDGRLIAQIIHLK